MERVAGTAIGAIEDAVEWQSRFADPERHYFTGFADAACRRVRWSPYMTSGLDVPKCLSCLVAVGEVGELEARELAGGR